MLNAYARKRFTVEECVFTETQRLFARCEMDGEFVESTGQGFRKAVIVGC